MNTALSAAPGRHAHPPEPTPTRGIPVRRVGLLDRLALHLGIALIAWSRRPRALLLPPDPAAERERLLLQRTERGARAEREWQAERRLLLDGSRWRV